MSAKKILKKNEYILKAKEIHGDKYIYSNIPFEFLTNQKIEIICPQHGPFFQPAKTHFKSKCKYCAFENQKLTTEEFIKRSLHIHNGKYNYSKSNYTGLYKKIDIICENHGIFKQVAKEHLKGSGCHLCKGSKGEKIIAGFLTKNKIDFIKLWVKTNNRKYFPDFYLPKYNLFIEYNGPQHYFPVIFAGMDEQQSINKFEKQKKRDEEFRFFCKEKNADLLEIDGREFKNEKLFEFLESYFSKKECLFEKTKPWGKENLLSVNSNYTFKKLFMKAGHSCSIQYHDRKHETFYVISGTMRFYIGDSLDSLESYIFTEGCNYVIPPGKIHRMEAVTDCTYLEASTSELFDVVRLEDSYGRVK